MLRLDFCAMTDGMEAEAAPGIEVFWRWVCSPSPPFPSPSSCPLGLPCRNVVKTTLLTCFQALCGSKKLRVWICIHMYISVYLCPVRPKTGQSGSKPDTWQPYFPPLPGSYPFHPRPIPCPIPSLRFPCHLFPFPPPSLPFLPFIPPLLCALPPYHHDINNITGVPSNDSKKTAKTISFNPHQWCHSFKMNNLQSWYKRLMWSKSSNL